MAKTGLVSIFARSVQEIYKDLLLTDLTDRQKELLRELDYAVALQKNQSAKKTSFPEDFAPNDQHYRWAASKGKPRSWVDSHAEDMRVWALSKGEKRANWPMTLYTFMRRSLEREASQNSSPFNKNRIIGGGYA